MQGFVQFEEEMQIELNDEEPAFLRGKARGCFRSPAFAYLRSLSCIHHRFLTWLLRLALNSTIFLFLWFDFEIVARVRACATARAQITQGEEVEPSKLAKNMDGTLMRAALTQSALTKERRELREQQQ